LILVIPEKPDSALEEKLKNLNIEILTYTWDDDQGSPRPAGSTGKN